MGQDVSCKRVIYMPYLLDAGVRRALSRLPRPKFSLGLEAAWGTDHVSLETDDGMRGRDSIDNCRCSSEERSASVVMRRSCGSAFVWLC